MSEELKRCPFCGKGAGVFQRLSSEGEELWTEVFCGWCGAAIRGEKRKDVIEKWNRRTEARGDKNE